jgi:hypothetical protein
LGDVLLFVASRANGPNRRRRNHDSERYGNVNISMAFPSNFLHMMEALRELVCHQSLVVEACVSYT